MPICFTTLEYRGDLAERLLRSPLLQFDEVRERGSAKVKRYYTTQKLRDFAFMVYPDTGKVTVKGSWPKFHNNGQHNYTRYATTDLLADIAELSGMFGYDFSDGLIHGLEAGVNLDLSNLPQPCFTPSYLIPRIICFQGRMPFLPMKSIKGAGHGVECAMHNYRIKIYDKGLQHHLPNPLLRLEYDCNMMKELKPLGIRLLSDLTDIQKMHLLGQKVQGLLADMVIMEPLPIDTLSTAGRKLYEKAERPSFWLELSRRNRNYYLNSYRDLIQTYSQYRLHETLCEQARMEWATLTENCNIFAGAYPANTSASSTKNCNIFSPITTGNRYKVLDQMAAVSFSDQTVNLSDNEQTDLVNQTARRCEVTGLLLHEQQPANSKVIGITTLTHDASALALLHEWYGSKQRKRDYHSEAYRLAHGPRNDKSNPPNNLLRRIRKAEADSELFGLTETLRLSTEQRAMLDYFDGTERAVKPTLKTCVSTYKDEVRDSLCDTATSYWRGVEKTSLTTGEEPEVRPQGRLTGNRQKKRPKRLNAQINTTLNLFPVEPNGC